MVFGSLLRLNLFFPVFHSFLFHYSNRSFPQTLVLDQVHKTVGFCLLIYFVCFIFPGKINKLKTCSNKLQYRSLQYAVHVHKTTSIPINFTLSYRVQPTYFKQASSKNMLGYFFIQTPISVIQIARISGCVSLKTHKNQI